MTMRIGDQVQVWMLMMSKYGSVRIVGTVASNGDISFDLKDATIHHPSYSDWKRERLSVHYSGIGFIELLARKEEQQKKKEEKKVWG